jgi:hypothetical protein
MILNKLIEWLHKSVGLNPEVQGRLFSSIIIVFALWCLHRLILRMALRRIKDFPARYRWEKTSAYIAAFLGI